MHSFPQFTCSTRWGEFTWVGAIIFGWNFIGRGQLFSGAIVRGAIFLGGSYPRGQLSGGQLSGKQSSRGQLSRGQLSGGQIFSGAIVRTPFKSSEVLNMLLCISSLDWPQSVIKVFLNISLKNWNLQPYNFYVINLKVHLFDNVES